MPPASPRLARFARHTIVVRIAIVLAVLGSPVVLWGLIHRFPGVGSAIADGARKVVGPAPIAKLEDIAYGLQDLYDHWRYRDTPPVAYWAPTNEQGASNEPPLPALPPDAIAPAAFAPPHKNVAAPGDGVWIAVADPHHPDKPSGLFKALVHPDSTRSYAALAVVAIDLSRVRVHAVPGIREPKSKALPSEQRPGMIPERDRADLLAAFNGGFQAVHGKWGMMVDGVTILPPRPMACTIARYRDGSMRVAVWKALDATANELDFFRQTPPCLVTANAINPAATVEDNADWGATVEGDTIIRRSAFGMSKDGKLAFYGMGDGLSAGSMARGMRVAGAVDVAQLDVNFSYPRFFFYDGQRPPHVSSSLAPVKGWKEDEYLRPMGRDFFYLTRVPASAEAASPAAAASAPSATPATSTSPLGSATSPSDATVLPGDDAP